MRDELSVIGTEPYYLRFIAGVRRPAHVEDPRVLADVLADDDGGELVVVLSQHDEPVERTVIHADGRRTAVRLPGLGATILHRR